MPDVDEEVIVRIGANTDDYIRGLDEAERRFMGFAQRMQGAKLPDLGEMMGMGSSGTAFGSRYMEQADLMLGAAGKMGQAATVTTGAIGSLDRMLGMPAPSAFVNQFTRHAQQMMGAAAEMTSAAAMATSARFDLDAALGMRPKAGPGTRGATTDEVDAIRRMRNIQLGLPVGGGPLQGPPSFARRPFDFNTRGPIGGGGGGGGPEDEGFRWNWMSSIIGGIGGRTIGGHLGGLGGMLGGGLAGPVGAVVGIGAGMGIHALEQAFNALKDAAIGAFSAIVHGSIEAGKYAVRLGMEYERSLTAFRVLTGDRATGERLFGSIQQLGINTPYTTRQLAAQGQVLLGYGTQPNQVVPTLSRLGDIAGGDPERLQRLTLAFGQVLSHGRLQGQELRQFAESGVGLGDFSITAGMSGRQFKEAMRDGDVSANIMIRTINRLTSAGGRFANASQEQMKTVSGAWSNLVERVEMFAGKYGMMGMQKLGIAENINELADDLAGLNKYGEEFVDWLGRGKKALDPFGDAFRAIKDDAADIFTGIFGNVDKWEDSGDVIKDWAKGVTAAFVIVREVVKSAYDVMMTNPRQVLGGLQAVEATLRQNPAINKALGDKSLIGNIVGMGELPKMWDQANVIAEGMMGQAHQRRMTERIQREGPSLVPGFGMAVGAFRFMNKLSPQISEQLELDPQAAKFAEHVAKNFKEGKGHPLDEFRRGMGLIAAAEAGKVGGGPAGNMLGIPGFGGAGLASLIGLSKEQADFGRIALFKELAGTVGADKVGMAPAAQQGSQAAQDIINQNQMETNSILLQVLATMEAAKTVAEQQKDIEQQQLQALSQWGAKELK